MGQSPTPICGLPDPSMTHKGWEFPPPPPPPAPPGLLEKPILKSTTLTKLHPVLFQGVIAVRYSCAYRWILVPVWRISPQGHMSRSLGKDVSGKLN